MDGAQLGANGPIGLKRYLMRNKGLLHFSAAVIIMYGKCGQGLLDTSLLYVLIATQKMHSTTSSTSIPVFTSHGDRMSRAPTSHSGRSGKLKIAGSSPEPGRVKPMNLKLILVWRSSLLG